MSELKACPFCGGSDIGYTHVETYSLDSSYDVFGCKVCGIGIDGCDQDIKCDHDQNVKEWNNRAIPEGMQLVPINTTATQKYHVNSEFSVKIDLQCPESDVHGCEDDCEICQGQGNIVQKITIPWVTCQDIYKAMLEAAKDGS